MHVSLMYPNDYIAAADLQGRDVTMTISRIASEELRVEGGVEKKWIVHFREMEERRRRDPDRLEKRLVLNKTNAKTIAKVYGGESDAWIGERITLYATTCLAFGERVDCIRIRPSKPKPGAGRNPKSSPDARPDDDQHEEEFTDVS